MKRDFTYIDDIVESIFRIQKKIGVNEDNSNIYNIGNSNSILLMEFISALEKHSGKIAIKNFMSMQPGDVQTTYSDSTKLYSEVGYQPKVNVDEGVKKFVKWYLDYSKITTDAR